VQLSVCSREAKYVLLRGARTKCLNLSLVREYSKFSDTQGEEALCRWLRTSRRSGLIGFENTSFQPLLVIAGRFPERRPLRMLMATQWEAAFPNYQSE